MANAIPTQITRPASSRPHRLDGADRDETVDPFPIGETPGRPFIRPHRLAQLVPGSYADDETIRAIRHRLNRPAWHIRIGLDVLLLTLVGILGWGLLLVGLYAWLGGAL